MSTTEKHGDRLELDCALYRARLIVAVEALERIAGLDPLSPASRSARDAIAEVRGTGQHTHPDAAAHFPYGR